MRQTRRKKHSAYPGFQIGTSYLLVIFVVLCLVTFAALSLSSALRDRTYSEKAASRTEAYCTASSEASAVLAQIAAAAKQPDTDLAAVLNAIDGVTVTGGNDILCVVYQIEMTDTQALEVAVSVSTADGSCQVTKWKEISVSEWEEQSTLPVLGSDRQE